MSVPRVEGAKGRGGKVGGKEVRILLEGRDGTWQFWW
jgi:hypothetical protein